MKKKNVMQKHGHIIIIARNNIIHSFLRKKTPCQNTAHLFLKPKTLNSFIFELATYVAHLFLILKTIDTFIFDKKKCRATKHGPNIFNTQTTYFISFLTKKCRVCQAHTAQIF